MRTLNNSKPKTRGAEKLLNVCKEIGTKKVSEDLLISRSTLSRIINSSRLPTLWQAHRISRWYPKIKFFDWAERSEADEK